MKTCYACCAEVPRERIGARDVCERCTAYLHCCRNCSFYEPGAHNDCREPSADLVADKEQGNFCDYFAISEARATIATPSTPARDRIEALFRKR